MEGIVVQGKIRTDDQNATDIENIERLPPLPKGSHYKSVDFRDLTDFEYEVEWERDGIEFDYPAFAERVPENLRKISNTKVAIEGFMIPTVVDENNEVKEFLLLPDQMSCCFGQTPEANGWVVVNADDGVEVMMDRIIRVTGELVDEERWDEEFFVGIYHMTCREIRGHLFKEIGIYFFLLVFAFADDLALPTETLTIKSGSFTDPLFPDEPSFILSTNSIPSIT